MKTYIGIDNGVTGSIAIISGEEKLLYPIPTKTEQDYTKKKQNITRLDVSELQWTLALYSNGKILCVLERPMINPGRFRATLSAIRCLEAELAILEALHLPYMYCDSKSWQKEFLPPGCRKEELKTKSADIGKRLFPELSEEIDKQKDADALLMAEWARRNDL